MKSAFALLALTTAIATSIAGVLTAAPIVTPGDAPASVHVSSVSPGRTKLAENDGDGEEGGWRIFGREDDHHEDGNRDGDEDDGATGGAAPASMNPAPAGQAAPPANGLFAPGAKPAAQVN